MNQEISLQLLQPRHDLQGIRSMKKFNLWLLVLCFAVGSIGCGGGGGGSVGDENDPAESSDTEQMEDETMDEDQGMEEE